MENRIPPPIIGLFSIFLVWATASLLPGLGQNLPLASALAAVLAVIGFAIAGAGVVGFRKAQTTVNPLTPEQATSLVSGGIYRLTRNPMYLGMLLVVIASGIFWQHLVALAVGAVFFFAYINRFQITPEEQAMEKLFGDEFRTYCERARRWL